MPIASALRMQPVAATDNARLAPELAVGVARRAQRCSLSCGLCQSEERRLTTTRAE